MLDQFRLWPQIRDQILSGPLGPHVDTYLSALERDGYTKNGIRRHIRGVAAFSAWLSKCSLSAEEIDEATVERFVASVGRVPSPRSARGSLPIVASCVRSLGRYLWAEGVADRNESTDFGDASGVLRSFEEHLACTKGLAPGTRKIYLRYARSFFRWRFGTGESEWSTVGPNDVVSFVQLQASRLKPSASRGPVTAIRALLRFLAFEGRIPIHLVRAVPTIRQWRHSSLPAFLTAEDVERVLTCTRDSVPTSRRDFAILLLLARLGLRASEVAVLELRDINWKGGLVHVRSSKTGRERCLPLSREIGDALVDYLRDARPAYRHSRLFLRNLHPHGPLMSTAITAVAKRAIERAGVVAPRKGAHVFRHTAATQMVRGGATFKEVADVLGHARIETTAIYAKLDVDTLAEIALPWPEGAR